jgi:hypothetical protein
VLHSNGKKIKQVLRVLRKHCPVSRTVRVFYKNLSRSRMCGCCIAYVNTKGSITRFVIEIDSSLSKLTAIDTLLHEWAHALDQDLHGVAIEPHRDSWGECFAKVWRAYDEHIKD